MAVQQSRRFELVKTPATPCRVPLFAPTRRPTDVKGWRVETAWGWGLVTGRLGQQHRDVLDAARMVAEVEEWTADGCLHLKVDPAKLRSALGGDSVNYARINEWLGDLMKSLFLIHLKIRDESIKGALIKQMKDSPSTPPTRAGAISEGRRYWRISFGEAWSKLIEDDLMIHYPLREVAALERGFSQAVARYCWSQANTNENVVGLCKKLADTGRVRDRVRDLQVDEKALAALGIELRNGCIFCNRSASKVPVKSASSQDSQKSQARQSALDAQPEAQVGGGVRQAAQLCIKAVICFLLHPA